MNFVHDDGGRAAAGFKGKTSDCVVRAIAIATGLPYREVYTNISFAASLERRKKGRSSPRTGVHKATTRRFLEAMGWLWTPTMQIGSGCKVHLADGELPTGRLIVSVSRHLVAVIDGVIHDTGDPQREEHVCEPDHGQDLKPGEWRNVNGIWHISRRCVYGYCSKA